MPLRKFPSAITMQSNAGEKPRRALTFSYDFSTDAIVPVSIAGLNFSGTQFTIDFSAFQNAKNFGAIRSLQINALFAVGFEAASARFFDGGLYIFSPASGQLSMLGYDLPNPQITLTADIQVVGHVSAVIPVVTNTPTILQFAKSQADDAIMYGSINVTAFDFDLPAYTKQFDATAIGSL